MEELEAEHVGGAGLLCPSSQMPLPYLLQVLEQSPLSVEQGADLGSATLFSGAQGPAPLFSESLFPRDTGALFLLEGLTSLPGPCSLWTFIPRPAGLLDFPPLKPLTLEGHRLSALCRSGSAPGGSRGPVESSPTYSHSGHSPRWGQCPTALSACASVSLRGLEK